MTAKELIQGFQKIGTSQLNEFLQGWLGDMKKYFGISLVLLCIFGNAESFKQYFKKLSNKKISSDSEYFKKSNIFQCENTWGGFLGGIHQNWWSRLIKKLFADDC